MAVRMSMTNDDYDTCATLLLLRYGVGWRVDSSGNFTDATIISGRSI
jgi:hypothetical protein